MIFAYVNVIHVCGKLKSDVLAASPVLVKREKMTQKCVVIQGLTPLQGLLRFRDWMLFHRRLLAQGLDLHVSSQFFNNHRERRNDASNASNQARTLDPASSAWVEFVDSRRCSEGFLQVLRFSSLHKNQHSRNTCLCCENPKIMVHFY